MSRILLLLMIIAGLNPVQVQSQPAAKINSVSLVHASIGGLLPAGNLNDRFGPIFSVGPAYHYKTNKNWLWGVEGDYLFGNEVKEDGLFDAISTEQGYIIDAGGLYADVYTSMRGYKLGAKGGKLIPLSTKDLNSGILLMGSVGFMQHKIRIDNKGNRAPQLDKEYMKGYDRLSNGLSLSASASYLHLGKKRIYNYFIGIEVTNAFTQSRREWDFDKMSKDETRRNDIMVGLKLGWILPIYGGSKENTYFYF